MATQWFYQDAGDEVGPVTGKKLKDLADFGTVMPWTPVRRVHNGKSTPWTRAGEVKALFSNDVSEQLGPSICEECGIAKSDGTCPKCEEVNTDVSVDFSPLETGSTPTAPNQSYERKPNGQYPNLQRYIQLTKFIGVLGALLILASVFLSFFGAIYQSTRSGNVEAVMFAMIPTFFFGLPLAGLYYIVIMASAEFLQLAIDVEENTRE